MEQIEQFKSEMRQLHSDMGAMRETLDIIKRALMGNEITNDGGLVGRIVHLEKENDLLNALIIAKDEATNKRIDALEREYEKSKVYTSIMWATCGALGVGIVGYVLQLIFHK